MFCILANIFVVVDASRKSLPITYGKNVKFDETPFMVALKDKASKELVCAGAIIAKNWVATAFHCVKDRPKYKTVVTVGSVIRSEGREYDILEIKSVPGYPNNDFALLKITPDIVFTKDVNLIAMAVKSIPVNTVARVYGWGQTDVSVD